VNVREILFLRALNMYEHRVHSNAKRCGGRCRCLRDLQSCRFPSRGISGPVDWWWSGRSFHLGSLFRVYISDSLSEAAPPPGAAQGAAGRTQLRPAFRPVGQTKEIRREIEGD